MQSQRRAMTTNAQTTIQLHLFQMLARLCSKSFRLGFSSMGTENFQRINCQHLLDHRANKGIPEKHLKTSASLLKGFDCLDHSKL